MSQTNCWTPERRALQAEVIRRCKPWEKSCGPKSPEGKRKVSRNAFKGGHRQVVRGLVQYFREQQAFLAEVVPEGSL